MGQPRYAKVLLEHQSRLEKRPFCDKSGATAVCLSMPALNHAGNNEKTHQVAMAAGANVFDCYCQIKQTKNITSQTRGASMGDQVISRCPAIINQPALLPKTARHAVCSRSVSSVGHQQRHQFKM